MPRRKASGTSKAACITGPRIEKCAVTWCDFHYNSQSPASRGRSDGPCGAHSDARHVRRRGVVQWRSARIATGLLGPAVENSCPNTAARRRAAYQLLSCRLRRFPKGVTCRRTTSFSRPIRTRNMRPWLKANRKQTPLFMSAPKTALATARLQVPNGSRSFSTAPLPPPTEKERHTMSDTDLRPASPVRADLLPNTPRRDPCLRTSPRCFQPRKGRFTGGPHMG